MKDRPVRVRFAPSPTGPLHMGGVRTALYNFLFARQHGGKFLLRIEDTDSGRFVPGAEEYIVESLQWCGIEIDEGVSVGGPHAPYRQSERKAIYLKYALQLVDKGWAYYAFDTPEELENIRREYESRGETFSYNHTVRGGGMKTSLSLPSAEVSRMLEKDSGVPWTIRFRMPENENIGMDDMIRGHVAVNSSTLDDKVLYKSVDELPTYHLANIVDDYLMEITHVIRGEEWLPSLPLHVMIYRAFGWEDRMPRFAHLPLLLKPTGGGKLSKRDGDKLGFPVFPLRWEPKGAGRDGSEVARGYREDGYFPEAFVNMLALLGWNPGNEVSEMMSMEEMIHHFNLEKVSKSGARFDPEKARWFNAQYLHRKSDAELTGLFLPVLEGECRVTGWPVEKVEKIVGLIKERAVFVRDFRGLAHYFFRAPDSYEPKALSKFWKGDNPACLQELRKILERVEDFRASELERAAKGWIEEKRLPMGQIMNTLRLALVGASEGVNVFDIAEVIGREEFLRRIEMMHGRLGD